MVHSSYIIPLNTKDKNHAWNVIHAAFYVNEVLFYLVSNLMLCVAFPSLTRIDFRAKIEQDAQGCFYVSITYHSSKTGCELPVFQSVELDCAKMIMHVYPRRDLPFIDFKLMAMIVYRIKSKIMKCNNDFNEEYEQLFILFNKMCAIKYSGFMNHKFGEGIIIADMQFIYQFLMTAVFRLDQSTSRIVFIIIKMIKSDILLDSERHAAKSIVNTVRTTSSNFKLRAAIENETNKYHVNAAALVLCKLK